MSTKMNAAAQVKLMSDAANAIALREREAKSAGFDAVVSAYVGYHDAVRDVVAVHDAEVTELSVITSAQVKAVATSDSVPESVRQMLSTMYGVGASNGSRFSRAANVAAIEPLLMKHGKVTEPRVKFVSLHETRDDVTIGIAKYATWLKAVAAHLKLDDITSGTEVTADLSLPAATAPSPKSVAHFIDPESLPKVTTAAAKAIVAEAVTKVDGFDLGEFMGDDAADLFALSDAIAALAHLKANTKAKSVADVTITR